MSLKYRRNGITLAVPSAHFRGVQLVRLYLNFKKGDTHRYPLRFQTSESGCLLLSFFCQFVNSLDRNNNSENQQKNREDQLQCISNT